MAFKGLPDYTTDERLEGKQKARMHLAYRKANMVHGVNTLVFCEPTDIDPAGVNGAELIKVSYIDGLTGAKRRKLGIEGEPLNVVRSTETIEMDAFNSTFSIDRRQIKSANEGATVIADNMNDATLSVCQALMQNLFKGKKGTDLSWNGLDYYFETGNALSGMDVKTVLKLSGGVTDQATAIKFGDHLRKTINGMGVNRPNFVYTTMDGLSAVQTYNQITLAGVKYVKVGDEEYDSVLGVAVCALPDEYFDSTVLAKGIPFYFVRNVKDKTGFVIVTKDGTIFDPVVPDLSKGEGRVHTGSNEIVCAPVPCTVECAARCIVDTSVAVAADTKG